MAFQLSPGVLVTEKDLTSIVPAVATSTGAFAGSFVWGPVMDPTLVSSENQLVARFGKPNDTTAKSFFTAANFLSYTNNLQVVRVNTDAARNAVATPSGAVTAITILDGGSNYTNPVVTFGSPSINGGIRATGTVITEGAVGTVYETIVTEGGSGYVTATIAFDAAPAGGVTAVGHAVIVGGVIASIVVDNPGSGYIIAPGVTITGTFETEASAVSVVGKVITGIQLVESGSGYTTPPSILIADATGAGFVGNAAIVIGGVKINNSTDYSTNYEGGLGMVGEFAAKYPGSLGNSIAVSMADMDTYAAWEYAGQFDGAPGTSSNTSSVGGLKDEVHVIVLDALGLWTGTRGAILEKYAFLSKASDARKSDGSNNYYRDAINTNSKYIWWTGHPASGVNWGNQAQGTTFSTISVGDVITSAVGGVVLSGGVDDIDPTDGQLQSAFALFANAEQYDISLIPTGGVSAAVAKFVIEQVAEFRKDCMAFVSPVNITTGEVITGVDAVEDIVAYRKDASFNVNSSYAVLDSGYKYQYDRYNDVYRWIPLNGDIAGLCARTDYTNDAWWSPSGLNRGQIKNVVKLAFSPNKTERDELYKNGVNPVVSFPGQGIVLFGDKTLLAKPSAFDRINVRRLFIVLEKAIATAAQYQLFEFNDGFTRAQFRSMVEPFLRDVQGRRGVTDFRVKCDDTNNTGEVIDRNEFVADIFIKPARSINFITLNFVAARTGISFDEIGA